jgi:Zn-dependent alcohol dehydrogenase
LIEHEHWERDFVTQTVRGVVARGKGAPVEVTDIVVPDPGPGEAVVRVQACGVCHTDLHYREGGINDEFPFLLGHEAAGIVEQVGDGVTDVAPGDFVVLNWRAVCGTCRACLKGKPWYCFNTHNAAQPMTLADGTPLSPALGIGAFAEKTLVHAGQCTKVDPQASPAVARRSTPATSDGVTASPSSAAAASARRRWRAPGSPGRPRSSRSTSTRGSWTGRVDSGRRTPWTRRRRTRWRGCRS